MARFLRKQPAMSNPHPHSTLLVFLLALPFACAPGDPSRAEPASGAAPRPVTALFGTPPGTGQAVVPPPKPPAGTTVPLSPQVRPASFAGQAAPSPGEACRVAIVQAAVRYHIPTDLMLAISLVESGHRDPVTGTRMPWPWTANLEGQDYRFETPAQAAAWVRQQQANGFASIDTGCMQVNLKHHPDAFATVEDAFDPVHNADYAARFLRSLYDGAAGGVWLRAAGFYHSQTPALADGYEGLVEAALKGPLPGQSALSVPLAAVPFRPVGGGQSLSNHAELARVIPMAGGQVGRGLDAYRAMPILLASRAPPLRVPTGQRP